MERQTTIVRWARIGAVALAWLFAAGVVGQVFLIGLSMFDDAARLTDHVDMGRRIGILPLLLLPLAAIGRLPRRLLGMAALVLVLYVVQMALANVDAGYVAALHAANAFVLFGLPLQLGIRIRGLDSGNRS